MSFKLSKNSGAGRAPDMVEDILAGSDFTGTPALVIAGTAITIRLGVLQVAHTTDAIAGYLTATFDNTVQYGGVRNSTFPNGVTATTGLLFQPVSRINPVVADVTTAEETAGNTVPGSLLNMHATNGLGLVGETDTPTVGTDFRVVKVIATDGAGLVTKVEGYFLKPGYFA
jgi:hypothetical protein